MKDPIGYVKLTLAQRTVYDQISTVPVPGPYLSQDGNVYFKISELLQGNAEDLPTMFSAIAMALNSQTEQPAGL